MREILFKAKHIHSFSCNERLNGRWIEGNLSDKNYIHSPELEGEFLIDSETICQYTGLTDKNGNRIWENDIVRCGGYFVVTWKEELASFCLSKKGWMYQNFFGEVVNGCDCEVVGNIFDNPELVEND